MKSLAHAKFQQVPLTNLDCLHMCSGCRINILRQKFRYGVERPASFLLQSSAEHCADPRRLNPILSVQLQHQNLKALKSSPDAPWNKLCMGISGDIMYHGVSHIVWMNLVSYMFFWRTSGAAGCGERFRQECCAWHGELSFDSSSARIRVRSALRFLPWKLQKASGAWLRHWNAESCGKALGHAPTQAKIVNNRDQLWPIYLLPFAGVLAECCPWWKMSPDVKVACLWSCLDCVSCGGDFEIAFVPAFLGKLVLMCSELHTKSYQMSDSCLYNLLTSVSTKHLDSLSPFPFYQWLIGLMRKPTQPLLRNQVAAAVGGYGVTSYSQNGDWVVQQKGRDSGATGAPNWSWLWPFSAEFGHIKFIEKEIQIISWCLHWIWKILIEMNRVTSPCDSGFRRFQKIKSDIDIRILFGIFVARLRVGILVTCLWTSKIKLCSCLRPRRAPPKKKRDTPVVLWRSWRLHQSRIFHICVLRNLSFS